MSESVIVASIGEHHETYFLAFGMEKTSDVSHTNTTDAENKTSYLLLLNIRISIDEALVFNLEDFETVDSCISSTLEHGEEMTKLQQISAYTDGLENENTKSADSPP
uniref:Uncharacterized protein n=1 Tax=Vespula pensylvanica TaxID=30213 RepID=A0A834JT46_VESPE|nr:hypothetical protein H0235_017488 [Vespula pensylvanica]